MANLLEKMNQVKAAKAAPPQLGQTERLRQMLGSKASGKAGQSSGPRASDVAERQVVAEQQAQAGQQQEQGQMQAEAANLQEQGQQQQFEQKKAQLQESISQNLAQFSRQSDAIVKDLERKDLARATEKDLFNLSQLGAAQALQDKKYTDKIQREGQKRRLDDSISFKEELQKSIFSEQEALFADELDFKELMDADEATFAKKMAKMDIATAQKMVENDIQGANDRLMYEGLSGIVSGGVKAYGAADEAGFFDEKREANPGGR